MNDQLWGWVLSLIGVAGFVLAGRKVWWCWYINIVGQLVWLAYALVTEQYGFLVGVVVYSAVFTKNAIAWTREHRAAEAKSEPIGRVVSITESSSGLHAEGYLYSDPSAKHRSGSGK